MFCKCVKPLIGVIKMELLAAVDRLPVTTQTLRREGVLRLKHTTKATRANME